MKGVAYVDFAGTFKFKAARACGAGHSCYYYQRDGKFNVDDYTSQSIVINSLHGGHAITDTGGSVVLK